MYLNTFFYIIIKIKKNIAFKDVEYFLAFRPISGKKIHPVPKAQFLILKTYLNSIFFFLGLVK